MSNLQTYSAEYCLSYKLSPAIIITMSIGCSPLSPAPRDGYYNDPRTSTQRNKHMNECNQDREVT